MSISGHSLSLTFRDVFILRIMRRSNTVNIIDVAVGERSMHEVHKATEYTEQVGNPVIRDLARVSQESGHT